MRCGLFVWACWLTAEPRHPTNTLSQYLHAGWNSWQWRGHNVNWLAAGDSGPTVLLIHGGLCVGGTCSSSGCMGACSLCDRVVAAALWTSSDSCNEWWCTALRSEEVWGRTGGKAGAAHLSLHVLSISLLQASGPPSITGATMCRSCPSTAECTPSTAWVRLPVAAASRQCSVFSGMSCKLLRMLCLSRHALQLRSACAVSRGCCQATLCSLTAAAPFLLSGFGWSSKPLVEYSGYGLWTDQIAGGAGTLLASPHFSRFTVLRARKGLMERAGARGCLGCLAVAQQECGQSAPKDSPLTVSASHVTCLSTLACPCLARCCPRSPLWLVAGFPTLQTSFGRSSAARSRLCWWATLWVATTRWPPLPATPIWSSEFAVAEEGWYS